MVMAPCVAASAGKGIADCVAIAVIVGFDNADAKILVLTVGAMMGVVGCEDIAVSNGVSALAGAGLIFA